MPEKKTLLSVIESQKESSASDKYDATEKISSTITSELVIALCGPIGSPLHKVAETVQSMLLKDFDYEKCKIIKLSEIIERYNKKQTGYDTAYERVKYLITKGDNLREKHGSKVLAEVAIHDIMIDRTKEKKKSKSDGYEPRRVCHIIDSIKNQEELEILKLVYRDMLYSIGVFSPLSERVKSLEKKGMGQKEIYELIDQDSGEELAHGQTVRETFSQSDFFLRIDSVTDTQIKNKVERFLSLILGTKVITPWASETAMYLAASAAGNSACLSRQVGAALTDENDEIISVGWNDVPKAGGNLYTSDGSNKFSDENDKRCWNLENGTCFNDVEKKITAEMLASDLVKANIIDNSKKHEVIKIILGKSKVKDLIEFSRSIHAEMHAILLGSQLAGEKVRNGKLYVTTYPCHSCARHIIATGVKEVYYIEPYRKSLATKLHDDAITESENSTDKVRVLPYEGVAPARYYKLFRSEIDRKKDGKLNLLNSKSASPKFKMTMEALPALEGVVFKSLESKNLIGNSSEEKEISND